MLALTSELSSGHIVFFFFFFEGVSHGVLCLRSWSESDFRSLAATFMYGQVPRDSRLSVLTFDIIPFFFSFYGYLFAFPRSSIPSFRCSTLYATLCCSTQQNDVEWVEILSFVFNR